MALLQRVHMMLKVTQHHRSLAQPIPTHGIDVVAAMGHGQGKAHGLLGTVLAHDFGQGLKLPCGLEWQVFEDAGFIQLMQGQRLQIGFP
jgi:hypothetical protein